jgi:hypothetical protein
MTAAATQIGFHTDEASAAHTATLEHVEPQWLPRGQDPQPGCGRVAFDRGSTTVRQRTAQLPTPDQGFPISGSVPRVN